METTILSASVLILIVVDDGLVLSMRQLLHFINEVLILVVVEDGLVQLFLQQFVLMLKRLNPCCSGRWSRTNTLVFVG